jgi:hypothetical protein
MINNAFNYEKDQKDNFYALAVDQYYESFGSISPIRKPSHKKSPPSPIKFDLNSFDNKKKRIEEHGYDSAASEDTEAESRGSSSKSVSFFYKNCFQGSSEIKMEEVLVEGWEDKVSSLKRKLLQNFAGSQTLNKENSSQRVLKSSAFLNTNSFLKVKSSPQKILQKLMSNYTEHVENCSTYGNFSGFP